MEISKSCGVATIELPDAIVKVMAGEAVPGVAYVGFPKTAFEPVPLIVQVPLLNTMFVAFCMIKI